MNQEISTPIPEDNKNERYYWNENDMEKLQGLATKYKNETITEDEKKIFLEISNEYMSKKRTGDHGYYGDCPSHHTSYDEYAFWDLPNGLCLEGRAMCRHNFFQFHDVLTAEERGKRIDYLKSTVEEEEEEK